MLFKSLILNLYTFVLYGLLSMMLWQVLARRFLMEKIFSLILVFILLSCCLLLSGLEFLPLIILLLYVGAIAVLFLFVVMIVNPDFHILLQEKKELLQSWEKNENNNSIKSVENQEQSYFSPVFLGILLGLFLSINIFCNKFNFLNINTNAAKQQVVMQDLGSNFFQQTQNWSLLQQYYTVQGLNLGQAIDSELAAIGSILYTKYGIGVIIVGIMLLVALIGAILLTLRQSPALKRQNIAVQAKRYRFTNPADQISPQLYLKSLVMKFNAKIAQYFSSSQA